MLGTGALPPSFTICEPVFIGRGAVHSRREFRWTNQAEFGRWYGAICRIKDQPFF